MSENYRFYVTKMAARRAKLIDSAALRRQLVDLFEAVVRCEAMWALESRIERGR